MDRQEGSETPFDFKNRKVMNVEKAIANSILQKDIEIGINGNKYKVERPRIGTMIKACAYIGELPQGKVSDEEFLSTLLNQKYYEAIVNAVVELVCGINDKNDREQVRQDILQEYDHNILSILIQLLNTLNSEVFFSLITFLQGTNLTKATKTTAFGQ